MKPKKVLGQIIMVMSIYLVIIQGLILASTHFTQKQEFFELRETINQGIDHKNIEIETILPNYFSDQALDKRLTKHRIQDFISLLLLFFFTTAGIIFVFHTMLGKHINKILELNESGKIDLNNLYPEDELPDNEIKELILSRNDLIKKLHRYTGDMEEKLDEAKQQLIHSAKLTAVGEFTSSIVHDIRNPLSVILMGSDQIKRGLEKENIDMVKIKARVEKMYLASKRIQSMVDRMGTLTRSEKEMVESCSIHTIIKNSLLFTESKLTRHKIQVENRITEDFYHCFGDEHSLEQVFTNLISNASDAMNTNPEDKRKLIIDCHDDLDFVYVRVADTGKGIADSDKEKIFQSFYTTKEKGKGTGLGLSSAITIIYEHHGEIKVESEVDKGTTFEVKIPKKETQINSLAS